MLVSYFPVNIEYCSLNICPLFRQIQLSLFNMRNICVTRLPLLDIHNIFSGVFFLLFKGTFSCLRWYLATESPLKMLKNSFYFTLNVLLVPKIFKFLSWLFVVEKLLPGLFLKNQNWVYLWIKSLKVL